MNSNANEPEKPPRPLFVTDNKNTTLSVNFPSIGINRLVYISFYTPRKKNRRPRTSLGVSDKCIYLELINGSLTFFWSGRSLSGERRNGNSIKIFLCEAK